MKMRCGYACVVIPLWWWLALSATKLVAACEERKPLLVEDSSYNVGAEDSNTPVELVNVDWPVKKFCRQKDGKWIAESIKQKRSLKGMPNEDFCELDETCYLLHYGVWYKLHNGCWAKIQFIDANKGVMLVDEAVHESPKLQELSCPQQVDEFWVFKPRNVQTFEIVKHSAEEISCVKMDNLPTVQWSGMTGDFRIHELAMYYNPKKSQSTQGYLLVTWKATATIGAKLYDINVRPPTHPHTLDAEYIVDRDSFVKWYNKLHTDNLTAYDADDISNKIKALTYVAKIVHTFKRKEQKRPGVVVVAEGEAYKIQFAFSTKSRGIALKTRSNWWYRWLGRAPYAVKIGFAESPPGKEASNEYPVLVWCKDYTKGKNAFAEVGRKCTVHDFERVHCSEESVTTKNGSTSTTAKVCALIPNKEGRVAAKPHAQLVDAVEHYYTYNHASKHFYHAYVSSAIIKRHG